MRIVISAYTSDPQGASESLNGWRAAEGAAQLGHDVVLVTRPENSRAIQGRVAEIGVSSSPKVLFVDDGIGRVISHGQLGVYTRYAVWQQRALAEARLLGLDSFDVVHHVSWGSVTHPVGLARLGPPLLLGPVGGGQFVLPAHEKWLDGPPRREILRRVYLEHLARRSPLAKGLARTTAVALATNPETTRLLTAMGARDVREMLVDALPDTELSNREATGLSLQVLWVGRFLPIKGARLALAAFSEILHREPKARLRMVGDGPTLKIAQDYARRARILHAVEFTGSLSWDAVQDFYTCADVFLFTSIRDSFGAQVLEAAAKGLPTVGINRSGVGRWLPVAAANLVDPLPGDDLPVRLADAVLSLMAESPTDRRSRSEAAYAWAAGNTWSVRAQTLSDLYREVG